MEMEIIGESDHQDIHLLIFFDEISNKENKDLSQFRFGNLQLDLLNVTKKPSDLSVNHSFTL